MNILKRILIKIERYTGSNVFKTVLILIMIVLVGSYLEYISQINTLGSQIKSPQLAIWFVFQTVTTVGYGDVVPVNLTGRIIAIIIMLAGIGTVTTLTASTAAYMTNVKLKHKIKSIRMKNHTIICNYNDYSKNIILNYLNRKLKIDSLVLIANLKENPVKSDYVFFTPGDPTDEKTLEEANASEAKRFIVTGDFSSNVPPNLIDAKTILNIFQIRKLNKSAEIIAQVASSDNVTNAKSAGADEVITLNELSALVISKSIMNPKLPDFVLRLLSSGDGPKIYSVKIPDKYIGYNLLDFKKIFKKIIILSVFSEDNYIFPVEDNYEFAENNVIYFISEENEIKGLLK
ncbi:ion channel [Ferroplasma acidarmanus]|uniref:Kef-type K+ transporter NAD-binding component n=1 Tax=Ferroplasma acidarmanus Fer1 TaxID=333146 RepID=S0APP3_FERAC|nr:ion channel [Ferroplasma acidarmanus]AGO60866.1 Kef-type K+ transporter NAD-binding component [Ferroplasma acidarmanus Fer1]